MKYVAAVVILILILAVLGVAGFGWYMSNYNLAVAKDQAVKQAWADVDVQLKRRYDLIPNLVATVKGYAAHEAGIFDEIAKAREAYFAAGTTSGKIAAADQVEGLLSRIIALQENYPNLKANENFLSLQDSLEGTENRIAVARTRYNSAVEDLNKYVRSYFGSYFAAKAGVTEAKYFEAPAAQTAAPPRVDFQSTGR